MTDLVRIRASRPEFRRAGLVFSSAAWVEVAPSTLSKAQSIALLEEPVLTIQGQLPDGAWVAMPMAERRDFAGRLRASLAEANPDNPREDEQSKSGAGDTAGPGSDGRVELAAIERSPGDGRAPLVERAPAAPPKAAAPKAAAKVPAKPSAAATRKAKAGK
jgi:hypothetical protein